MAEAAKKAAKKSAGVKAPAKKSAAKKAPAKKASESAAVESTGSAQAPAKKQAGPSHEEISRLAYSYWKERGGHSSHGSHHGHDWARAEQELRKKDS